MSEPRRRKPTLPGVAEILSYLVEMSDGSAYTVKDFTARDAFKHRVEMTIPLGTRMKGYNSDLAELISDGGSDLYLYSFNRSADNPTSLSQDVYAYGLIRRELNARKGIKPGQRRSINYGQSRGGMAGLGIMAFDSLFKEHVDLGLHVDDCLPDETDTWMTIHGLPPQNMAQELLKVPSCIKRHRNESRGHQLQRALRWSKSVGVTPTFLKAQVHSGRALWKGEAGIYAAHMDPSQGIVLHAFNRNKLNGRNEYVKRLGHLPFFQVIDEDEQWHMDLGREEVIYGSAEKLVVAQEALDDNATVGEVVELIAKPFFPKKAA